MKKFVTIVLTCAVAGTLLALMLAILWSQSPETHATHAPPAAKASANSVQISQTQTIFVDDFKPQPYQGDPIYYYNRIGGDRGALNDSIVDWGRGQVTATITPGQSWGGIWMSLNHPITEGQAVNFSAVLPAQISPTYQSRITDLTVQVAGGTAGREFRVELKDRGTERWRGETVLTGGPQTLTYDLSSLEEINELVLVLDGAASGDHIVLERISLTATTPITDVAWAAFTWSYGMLLNNWNPDTGLVRDKAKDPSGNFDAIQSTGALAAATAMAEQLGVVDRADAVSIVEKIGYTLLISTPRYHGEHGLWPHWVEVQPSGAFTIAQDTEWSSVDTAIAAIALLTAQEALDLDTAGTEQMLRGIDWDDLLMPAGLSHGYTYARERIPHAWDTFGGESWLLALAYAAATGEAPPIAYPTPPTVPPRTRRLPRCHQAWSRCNRSI